MTVSESCKDWKYDIFVKDFATGAIKKLYSYPKPITWYQNLLIKKAQAGGCPLIPFPLAWSKNDQKVILKLGNPTSCGSGDYTHYWYFSINPSGGKLEDLAYGDGIFLDSYSKVVYTDFDPDKGLCGTMGGSVGKGIVLKDIESGKITNLVGKTGLSYSLVKVDDQQNTLTFTAAKITQAQDGCFESIPPVSTETLPL